MTTLVVILAVFCLVVMTAEKIALKLKGDHRLNSVYNRITMIEGKKFYLATVKATVAIVTVALLLTAISNPGVLLAAIPLIASVKKERKLMLQFDVEQHTNGIVIHKNNVPMRQYIAKCLGEDTVVVNVNSKALWDKAMGNGFFYHDNLDELRRDLSSAIKDKRIAHFIMKDGVATLFYSNQVGRHLSGLSKLGLNIVMSFGKANKYQKRLFANYLWIEFGKVKDLVVLRDQLNSATDGQGMIRLSAAIKYFGGYKHPIGVGSILMVTIFTSEGMIKTHLVVCPDNSINHDIICYDIKDGIKAISEDLEFIGLLNFADGKDDGVKTDIQSMISFKLEDFYLTMAFNYVDNVVRMMTSKTELMKLLNMYTIISSQKEEMNIILIKYLKALVNPHGVPKFWRSMYKFFFHDLMNIEKMRIPVTGDNMIARYLKVDPTAFNKDGTLKPEGGFIKQGECFISGGISQVVALHRQPCSAGEYVILNAKAYEELLPYEGNAIYLSAADLKDLERILYILGGADLDDRAVIYLNESVIEHFKTLKQVEVSTKMTSTRESEPEIDFSNRTSLERAAIANFKRKNTLARDENQRMVDTHMDDFLHWMDIRQEDAIDISQKEQGNISITDKVVWAQRLKLTSIPRWLVKKVIGTVFLENKMMKLIYRREAYYSVVQYNPMNLMRFKPENDWLPIPHMPDVEYLERKVYDMKSNQLISDTIIEIKYDEIDRVMSLIRGKILDVLTMVQEHQLPEAIEIDDLIDKMRSVPTSSVIESRLKEYNKIWRNSFDRDPNTAVELTDIYNIACYNVAKYLSQFSAEENMMLAARNFVFVYLEKTITDDTRSRITDGSPYPGDRTDLFEYDAIHYGNFPDAALWAKTMRINVGDDKVELKGMADYVFDIMENVHGFDLKAVTVKDSIMSGTVTVNKRSVKMNGVEVGLGRVKNGTYEMEAGIIRVPKQAKQMHTLGCSLRVYKGWATAIREGRATADQLAEYKTANVGQDAMIVRNTNEKTGKFSYDVVRLSDLVYIGSLLGQDSLIPTDAIYYGTIADGDEFDVLFAPEF